jgi:hypothetical protein
MHTDDTPPTLVSVDDRFHGLPTGNTPRTHRPAKKPTGLNWEQINAEYEARNGVRKDDIWEKGKVVIAGRGSGYEQSFVENTDYEEPPIPPRLPAADPVVVPEGLDQVDREEMLTGETYEGFVETPKPAKGPRYDYDIWTKDPKPEPTPEPAPEPKPTDPSGSEPRRGGRQRAFSPEQTAELVRRYEAGESTTTLAGEYDSNHATIWRTLTREGVQLRQQGPPTGRRPAFTREQETDLVRRYRLGESMESIAAEYNTYATTVRRALIRNNVTLRPRGAPRHTEQTTLKQREGDQPLPIANEHQDIQSMVIADLEARRQVGIQRYGTALQPHNGRDMLLDAYEEAMDLTVYLKGCLVERDSNPPAV